jgi:hypothetical protein
MSEREPERDDTTAREEKTRAMEEEERAAERLERMSRRLDEIMKEEETSTSNLSRALSQVFTITNLFTESIMVLVSEMMKQGAVTERQKDEFNKLTRFTKEYYKAIRELDKLGQEHIKLLEKNRKEITEMIKGLGGQQTAIKNVEKALKTADTALEGYYKIIDLSTNAVMGFVDQKLRLYRAEVNVIAATNQVAQAQAFYNYIVGEYGENSKEAQAAAEALGYAQTELNEANKEVINSTAKLDWAWLETGLNMGISVVSIINAIGVLMLLAKTFPTVGGAVGALATPLMGLVGIIGLVVIAFAAVGDIANIVMGGYDKVAEKSEKLAESAHGPAKGMMEIGNSLVQFAGTLPAGLSAIVEGVGIVIQGWASLFTLLYDIAAPALTAVFDFIKNIINAIYGVFNWFAEVGSVPFKIFSTAIEAIFDLITGNIEGFKKAWDDLKNFLSGLLAPFKDIAKTIGDIFKPVTDLFGGLFGGGKPAQPATPVAGVRQVGGEVEERGLYLLHPGEMITRRGFEGGGAGGEVNVSPVVNMNLTFNVSKDVDIETVRNEVVKAVSSALQSALMNRGIYSSV